MLLEHAFPYEMLAHALLPEVEQLRAEVHRNYLPRHCQLVCQFYKDDPTRERQNLQLATDLGTMVIFNGDKLWHAVTPLEPEAERIMLSMQYVTSPTMGAFQRCLSNLKDAIAYFGVSALARGRRGARHTRTTAGHRRSSHKEC
jgi:hypothetical protein